MERDPNLRVGIPEQSFVDPVWFNVVRIYYETMNGHYVPDWRDIEAGLKHTAAQALQARDGYRWGSKLSAHTKLNVNRYQPTGLNLVYFGINPNADPQEISLFEKYEKTTVPKLISGFTDVVDDYLLKIEGAQQFDPTHW